MSTLDFPKFDTLKELTRCVAERYADEIAFIVPPGGGEDTDKSFRAFAADVDAFGTALFARGLRGCSVAILGGNSYEWIVAYFAAVNGGCTVVPLDRDWPAGDLAPLLEKSGCAALVYAPKYEAMLPLLSEGTGLRLCISTDEMALVIEDGRQRLEAGDDAYITCDPLPETPAVIVYTSGTTGDSKGVMLTHSNLTTNAVSISRMITCMGRGVLVLPLHHTFGMMAGVIIPMLFGASNYISRSVMSLQKDIEKTKATMVFLVPAVLENIYKRIWASAEHAGDTEKLQRGLKLSRSLTKKHIDARRRIFKDVLDAFGGELNMIVCGGAPLNPQIADDFCAMGIDLLNGYGITECSPVVSVNPNHPRNKVGSTGLPLDCCSVRIAGADKKGIGEIQVQGSNVMPGYYGNEQATRETFTEDGWFKTGDLGRLDEDGYLFVTGRIKNLIILSNGKNVSPEELEIKVIRIPGVEETSVYEEDDLIAAEIYAGTEREPETEESIRGAVREMNRGLPVYKHIERVKFRDTEFPKTTTMKIKKHPKQKKIPEASLSKR